MGKFFINGVPVFVKGLRSLLRNFALLYYLWNLFASIWKSLTKFTICWSVSSSLTENLFLLSEILTILDNIIEVTSEELFIADFNLSSSKLIKLHIQTVILY